VIEQERERVTLEEINEWIDEMPRLMNEVCERGGRPIVGVVRLCSEKLSANLRRSLWAQAWRLTAPMGPRLGRAFARPLLAWHTNEQVGEQFHDRDLGLWHALTLKIFLSPIFSSIRHDTTYFLLKKGKREDLRSRDET
jgi:hypothetical protein